MSLSYQDVGDSHAVKDEQVLAPRSSVSGHRTAPLNAGGDARGSIPASFFARAATPMLLVDSERRLRQANRAALRMFGLQLSALTSHRLDELVAKASSEALDADWRRVLDVGQGRGRWLLRRSRGGPGKVTYSATARIAGDLHLLVLIPSASPGAVARGPALSSREREILTWTANGEEGSALAGRLAIAPETVRRHLSNARKKLGARSRAHAVALALARGEIDWPAPSGDSGD